MILLVQQNLFYREILYYMPMTLSKKIERDIESFNETTHFIIENIPDFFFWLLATYLGQYLN